MTRKEYLNENSKNRRRRRRVARKAPAQSPSNGFSQNSHVPVRFPLFPRQLQFSSTWTQTVEVNLGSGPYRRQIGLFDYLGNLPQYTNDAYELYRYSRICAVELKLIVVGEMTSASTNYAIEAGMARLPYDEALGTTPQELRTVRAGKYALAAQAGSNRLQLSGMYGAFDELGNPVYDRTYWQTQAEAFNATPVDNNRPVIAVVVGSTLTNPVTASINLSVTYHMQFFDLEIPPLPAKNPEIKPKPQQLSAPQGLRARKRLRVNAPSHHESESEVFEEVDAMAGIYKVKRT